MANVKVKLIGAFDMLKFKNQKKTREKQINKAKLEEVKGVWAINENAKAMHPYAISLIVDDIIDHKDAHAKTFIFKNKDKSPLPYFRAGKYLSLKLKIGNSYVTRGYSISSSPKYALEGKYALTIKDNKDGFVAPYMLKKVKVGDEIISSGPLGDFYYDKYRDEKTVVAVAGGSGITPFLSMAYAIRDGIEDFNLIILFGSRDEKSILFKNELESIAKETNKVKIIHVLSDEKKKGYEHGFITADLIKKMGGKNYSIFVCGPSALYSFLDKEFKKLKLSNRLIRKEALSVTTDVKKIKGYPKVKANKVFNITINQGPNTYKIKAKASEPILVAIERAGIIAPSRCRSGECGYCRSRVVKGTYFIASRDARRFSDITWNQIHPCVSFPTSDMIIDLPGEYIK